ncbi:putative colanic acid biosynthesis acetyltransferase [Synechococcus sp. MIT S9452]|uniref:putative colanic acid biosynthesis acetyltransferase n=1 Tax=Synechococcus sp. MIT S9452 TaxID=3082546 RepID=UPI0039A6105B
MTSDSFHKSVQLLDQYSLIYESSFLHKARRILWYFPFRWLVSSQIPGTIWRKFILRLFGASVGKHGRIKPGLTVTSPWHLSVGDYCWIGENTWIDNLAQVTISDHVCISQLVYLCTGNHNYKTESFDLLLSPIMIEGQSWIGANATLAPGTYIGFGAVITLGSVVSGMVPPYSIVKGNPSAVIGLRPC